jgi:hypothetical protein
MPRAHLRLLLATALLFAVPLSARAAPVDHKPFTDILSKYVLAGSVDYGGLLKNRVPLDRYCDSLHRVTQGDYNRWSSDDQLAFWINLYNAEMLKLMIDHPNTKSVRSVAWFLGAFREKFIQMPGFGEKQMSLNGVLNDVLARNFHDPRIYFALVGAAKGAPRLRSEAYEGRRLSAQLEEQARDFCSNPANVRYDPAASALYLSKIFDWHHGDFEKAGGVVKIVSRYADPAVRDHLSSGPVRLKSLDYDWSLNGGW